MLNTFNSLILDNKQADGHSRTNNPYNVSNPINQPKINSNDNGKNENVGTYLANGVTSVAEAKAINNNDSNFFVTGYVSGEKGLSSEDVQALTQRISQFKVAYANFTSFPTKDTAIALNIAYFGKNGDDPINNKSVKQLYEMKRAQIDALIKKN